jgi:MFS family permease
VRRDSARRLPGTVWALGTVSLFMDASSELVHSVLPLFLSVTLGASIAAIGVIEGIAEAIAQFAKLASGTLSDATRRKPWIVAGYGLAALTKPLFPLANAIAPVAVARFTDRLGKGIRGAPRDALLADVTAPDQRGAAFGLRQTLDTVGAILGPLAAAGLLLLYTDDIRAVLWWAVLPAIASVLVLVVFVREPETHRAVAKPKPSFRNASALPAAFWWITALASLLTVARFSEAFLLLRGTSLGMDLSAAPVILAGMSLVYALSSYPAGAASDRLGRSSLLALGIVALAASHAALALAANTLVLALGVGLWGLHMGLTQGLLAAMVADVAPLPLRGTAFGVFYALTGVALLIGSAAAGLVWELAGAPAPFVAGAGLALITLLLMAPVRSGRQRTNM